MSEKPKFVPPTEESENPREYERREEEPYFNKKDHASRTVANEEAEGRKKGHKVFWRKQKKKEDEET